MTFPYFLIPILVGLTAQFLKSFFNREMFRQMKHDGQHLPHYGGMPSAHSAFVLSLATVVAVTDGPLGVSFAIAAAVVIFILDDALRMRIFLGRHGTSIKKLIEKLPEEERSSFPKLEARLGHKPMEVVAGATLGVLLTLVIMQFVR